MYQITLDDEILYDVRLKDRLVLSPVLDLETGKNGTLSFKVPCTNELYDKISQKKSIIKVYQRDKINGKWTSVELFRGTAFAETIDFYKNKKVDCEGELSFFNDTIVRPYSYQGNVEDLFKQYINNHNSQVEQFKRFIPRKCTVIDKNNYIIRSNINYPTTKSEVNEKLLDNLGGHLKTGSNEDGSRYIDYLLKYEDVAKQKIEFGKNALDITQYIKTEDICTRLVPLGKKDDNGNYLTIKNINNGLDYVQDDAAVALFGVIEKTCEFQDVTQAENLFKKAKSKLQELIDKSISIEISAADLHNLDTDIDAFRVRRKCTSNIKTTSD